MPEVVENLEKPRLQFDNFVMPRHPKQRHAQKVWKRRSGIEDEKSNSSGDIPAKSLASKT